MKTLFKLGHSVKQHVALSLIKGVVTKKGVPLSCIVRAYNRQTGEMLSQTQSKPDGYYILFGTSNVPSYVIAIDPEVQFNIAAQDNIS